jgi:hypothetical protein
MGNEYTQWGKTDKRNHKPLMIIMWGRFALFVVRIEIDIVYFDKTISALNCEFSFSYSSKRSDIGSQQTN